jgi:DNA polymerase III subunit beta
MKLTCTQENFKKAVFNSERVVSKQTTLPILNNILFEGGKSGLKLSATNLEIGVVVKIGAKVDKEGKITVPAKLISNFINNLPAGENMSLEIIDQNLKIKSGSAKAIIKGLPATDFPLIPQKNNDFQLQISGKDLKTIINKVITSVAFNEARPELTGINLILKEKELLFASTDSFRLSEICFNLGEKNINAGLYGALISKRDNIIIPATTMVELARIISADEEQEVKIAIEEGQAFFEINGTTLVSRLINGKYPEYKHIMPKEFKSRLVGEKNLFQGAVRMASVFTSSKTNEIILKNDAEAKKVFIEARSVEVGENSTELKLDSVGPSQEVIFNSKYLLDGINTIATLKLAVLINNGSTPIALREIDEKTGKVLEGYTYIVMPIKN